MKAIVHLYNCFKKISENQFNQSRDLGISVLSTETIREVEKYGE